MFANGTPSPVTVPATKFKATGVVYANSLMELVPRPPLIVPPRDAPALKRKVSFPAPPVSEEKLLNAIPPTFPAFVPVRLYTEFAPVPVSVPPAVALPLRV